VPDVYSIFVWVIAALAFALSVQAFGVTGGIVALALILFAITAFGYLSAERLRRQRRHIEPRFQRTDELFRDPRSGKVTRVYIDPATGERRYKIEPTA
jgi:membrane protein implicated in regulation of membrane protease activity